MEHFYDYVQTIIHIYRACIIYENQVTLENVLMAEQDNCVYHDRQS